MNLMNSGMWGIGFALVDMRQRKLLKRFVGTPMRRSDFLLALHVEPPGADDHRSRLTARASASSCSICESWVSLFSILLAGCDRSTVLWWSWLC